MATFWLRGRRGVGAVRLKALESCLRQPFTHQKTTNDSPLPGLAVAFVRYYYCLAKTLAMIWELSIHFVNQKPSITPTCNFHLFHTSNGSRRERVALGDLHSHLLTPVSRAYASTSRPVNADTNWTSAKLIRGRGNKWHGQIIKFPSPNWNTHIDFQTSFFFILNLSLFMFSLSFFSIHRFRASVSLFLVLNRFQFRYEKKHEKEKWRKEGGHFKQIKKRKKKKNKWNG